ncbi:hypothetical protein FKM82_014532 [Ascaphus truei]
MVGMRSRRRFPCCVMRRFLKCLRHRRWRFKFLSCLVDYLRYWRLCIVSLCYNSFTNSDVVIESLFEPIYWVVDHVTRWFGIVFVALVIILTSSIVLIVYSCVLPLILQTYSTAWIWWHISYGHWNLLMIVFHYYKAITTPPGYPPQAQTDTPSVSICRKCIAPKPARTHHCSICSSSVALALGALTLWHAILITHGETSIERHINKKEIKRLQSKGKLFHNPYSYGRCHNWRIFLGVETKKHWVTRVLLPSSHPPDGNGLTWAAPSWIPNKQAFVHAI